MMRLEVTVTDSWLGVDPSADLDFLVRAYSDGSRTVATRMSHSGEAWGPEHELRAVSA